MTTPEIPPYAGFMNLGGRNGHSRLRSPSMRPASVGEKVNIASDWKTCGHVSAATEYHLLGLQDRADDDTCLVRLHQQESAGEDMVDSILDLTPSRSTERVRTDAGRQTSVRIFATTGSHIPGKRERASQDTCLHLLLHQQELAGKYIEELPYFLDLTRSGSATTSECRGGMSTLNIGKASWHEV